MERIPRVSRVEYLFTFLEGISKKLSTEELSTTLGKCKLSFEEKKYEALGRGRPLAKKFAVAKSLVNECMSLAKRLRLLDSEGKSLTPKGVQLLRLPPNKKRDMLAQLYINSFEIVKAILVKMNFEKNKEFSLPDYRRGKFKEFNNFISNYGLTIDVLSFIAVRDILWQLGCVNWYQYRKNGEHWFKVYLTAQLAEKKIPIYMLTFTLNSKTFYVKKNEIDLKSFLDILWMEYMKQTKDVQYIPVLYSEMRNKVCYELRISDETFDNMITKILTEDKTNLRIIWSSGAVPYERDTLSLLKNLPALSPEGQYMTYLLIGRD
jgi:hypothetical protein